MLSSQDEWENSHRKGKDSYIFDKKVGDIVTFKQLTSTTSKKPNKELIQHYMCDIGSDADVDTVIILKNVKGLPVDYNNKMVYNSGYEVKIDRFKYQEEVITFGKFKIDKIYNDPNIFPGFNTKVYECSTIDQSREFAFKIQKNKYHKIKNNTYDIYESSHKKTNLFMKLNETTADLFYNQPDIYLKCIEAGAKYLKEEPYPANNQSIKFEHGYHPEKETNRERWWKNAIKPIKAELKDHYGPGFTKQIRCIILVLADEGNAALENMKQFISTGTCEQYELFTEDNGSNSNDAGGQYIDDEAFDKAYSSFDFHYPKPTCVECGAPLTKEEVERYDDTCEACALDDIGRDRHYDGPDVGDLFESIMREDATHVLHGRPASEHKIINADLDHPEYYGYCFFYLDDNEEEGSYVSFNVQTGKLNLSGFPWKWLSDDPTINPQVKIAINHNRYKIKNFLRQNGPFDIVLKPGLLEEGTNTEKKNYIDIKGEKAPLDWDRIDDKIEKVGFGKDLYECIIRESEIKSWYEPFINFYYQIYNGGVSQPIGLNPGYYKAVDELLSIASHNDILAEIYEEKYIPEEVKPLFEEFVRNVIEVCEAVSSTTFYKPCEYCGGSGEEYVMDEDEDGNDHSYYDTCINCGGSGEVQCSYDDTGIDYDNIKAYLNLEAQRAWDELENKCSEYQKMFKVIEGKE